MAFQMRYVNGILAFARSQVAPFASRSASPATRRAFHRTAPVALWKESPASGIADTDADAKSLSKEELAAFEDGTHPALHSPIEVHELDSLRVSRFAAPNSGHITLLTLNEPKSFNALSKNMIAELSTHVEAIHAAPASLGIRALVLASSSDKAFCAGANLKERAAMSPDETTALLAKLRTTFSRLSLLPVPTVAAVHGIALGGGLELALCANLRVCAADAVLGQPETGLGIIPGAGGTHRLPRLVGPSRALDMMLSGRRLSGAEALAWGLCDRVVPGRGPAAVLQEAMGLAARIAAKAPLATRAVLQAAHDPRADQAAENDAYATILHTQDRVEALNAFREKRQPVFRGR